MGTSIIIGVLAGILASYIMNRVKFNRWWNDEETRAMIDNESERARNILDLSYGDSVTYVFGIIIEEAPAYLLTGWRILNIREYVIERVFKNYYNMSVNEHIKELWRIMEEKENGKDVD